MATYGATKAAVHSYTESLRAQLNGTGIEVALPLDDYLDEAMDLLKEQPTPREIVVKAALFAALGRTRRHVCRPPGTPLRTAEEAARTLTGTLPDPLRPAVITDNSHRTEGTVMSRATLLDRNKAFAATDAVAQNPQIPWLLCQLAHIIACIDSRTEPAGFVGVELGDATV